MDLAIFYAAVAEIIIQTRPKELPEPDTGCGRELYHKPPTHYLRMLFDIDRQPCYIINMLQQHLTVIREDVIETVFLGHIDHYAPNFHIHLWAMIQADFNANYTN